MFASFKPALGEPATARRHFLLELSDAAMLQLGLTNYTSAHIERGAMQQMNRKINTGTVNAAATPRFGMRSPSRVFYLSVDLVYRSAFPLVRVESTLTRR